MGRAGVPEDVRLAIVRAAIPLIGDYYNALMRQIRTVLSATPCKLRVSCPERPAEEKNGLRGKH